ncbi:hypothetical protein DXF96_11440 [Heyndrickxia coagulans]|nr:hypothetical protein C3766_05715 [Heyndrickxia coagulans]AWP36540.1 hypothetical protein CYJ15_05920 [Heyndrickxia coagulans]KGT38502.1 hypothetical protein P421_09575 [Heyndrickxia coagulans P38]QDI62041.1 hypothetical protein DXF96_11440 [Heyndrickxia coagulans]
MRSFLKFANRRQKTGKGQKKRSGPAVRPSRHWVKQKYSEYFSREIGKKVSGKIMLKNSQS